MLSSPGSIVQSVERAISILDAFTLDRPERGVGELSRELGLHKSTVSRLMATLERGGLLDRDSESQRYRLGIGLLGLAAQVVAFMDVRDVARPVLRELAQMIQESVNLVVWDAGTVVNLEQFIPPDRQVKNIGRVGRRMPPHCTAAGKVLLAHVSPEQRNRVLASELDRFTERTILEPKRLLGELVDVQQQGYATAQEELEEGMNALATPIFDHRGEVVAAIGVAGPAYRVTPEKFPQVIAHLMDATQQISAGLGYQQD